MKLFLRYLGKFRLAALAAAAFCAVFAAAFALYELPVGAVVYPALFCLFLAVIFIAVDYSRTLARYRRLTELSRMTAAMIDSLPDTPGLEAEGYRELVEALIRENGELRSQFDRELRETEDYYTVWVHQIKIPITAMSLTLQNNDSELADKLSSDLRQISGYVEMVLAFLRLRSESTDYVFREYELDPVIKRCVAKFSSEFIDRGLGLRYEPVNMNVVTDEKWLAFVIEQVLSNALKYTPSGSISIGRADDRTIFISDTGVGIAPEDLPRIFERGYTGLNGRADGSASGIGLYLCKRICHALGADITVESELGKGTAVYISFGREPGE